MPLNTPHGFVFLIMVPSRLGMKLQQRSGIYRGGANAIARIGPVRISAKALCQHLRANWISGV